MLMLLTCKLISELFSNRKICPFTPKAAMFIRGRNTSYGCHSAPMQFTVWMQAEVWCQSVVRWEILEKTQAFSLLWIHFCHYFLILSLLLILVKTFGTHRVGEDDVLLEKWVLPCHISAPERSNTNMQSNQRQAVPVMSSNCMLCGYSATKLLRILCPE